MLIELETRNVYGRKLLFPINDLSKAICDLCERKSMTQEMIDKWMRYGWKVIIDGREQGG